jgi:hypothetical protein
VAHPKCHGDVRSTGIEIAKFAVGSVIGEIEGPPPVSETNRDLGVLLS